MTTYVKYQCSICRRTKDILKDNKHAAPNQCTITKGCSGRLFKIGESAFASTVDPRSDLVDWYPRGQTPVAYAVAEINQPISLICSSTGVLTLAVNVSDAEALSANMAVLHVNVTQRRAEDISYQQYLFKYPTETTLVSGRDSTGKNLRFDQIAIDEQRIFVRVNGVARFTGNGSDEIKLTPNTISFNSPIPSNSTIDISIYTEKDTIQKSLLFLANRTFTVNANSGSWGNVRYVEEIGIDGNLKSDKWWLYSCASHTIISPSSRVKIDSILKSDNNTVAIPEAQFNRARFLLASKPYQNADRYLNFYVACDALHSGFSMLAGTTSNTEIFADKNTLVEVYPPFQLKSSGQLSDSSFVTMDVFVTDNSIQTDTSLTRMAGKKILGPV